MSVITEEEAQKILLDNMLNFKGEHAALKSIVASTGKATAIEAMEFTKYAQLLALETGEVTAQEALKYTDFYKLSELKTSIFVCVETLGDLLVEAGVDSDSPLMKKVDRYLEHKSRPCCTNRELNKLSLFPNFSLCSAHGDWSANF